MTPLAKAVAGLTVVGSLDPIDQDFVENVAVQVGLIAPFFIDDGQSSTDMALKGGMEEALVTEQIYAFVYREHSAI
ncbi:hypothetical protein LP421_33160 (plasmid) [Rhizobium sp. RCAM05350]|uniref:hypothetical protein n=1 Tax=Rhizobium sp. RCAM05350 TaxID=2895568 RepID=UPI002076B519|nr:hypothetical protein [Rhizobium sp. RCAM05350]URK89508.1 hypothetical protein LP421_33160 [Rhizobium sp. RCAM05350]